MRVGAVQAQVQWFACAWRGWRACSGAYMRTTHHVRHCCAQNADHLAHGSPLSAFFAEVVCSLAATPPPVGSWPTPNGGNGVIRGVTRRQHAASHLLMLQNPHRRRCGGRGGPGCGAVGGGGAWLGYSQRPGPTGVKGAGGSGGHGRASRQRAETHTSMPVAAGVEGIGGTGGPGCGARGRRRGLAGLRDDAPSRRLVARTASGRAGPAAAETHTGGWARR